MYKFSWEDIIFLLLVSCELMEVDFILIKIFISMSSGITIVEYGYISWLVRWNVFT